MEVTFTVTTEGDVSAVRLADENGVTLVTGFTAQSGSGDTQSWQAVLPVTEAMESLLTPELYDGSEWVSGGQTIRLSIGAAALSAEQPALMQPAADTEDVSDLDIPLEDDEEPEPEWLPEGEVEDVAMEEETLLQPDGRESDLPAEPTPAPTEAPQGATDMDDTPEAEPTATPEPTERPALTVSSVKSSDPSLLSTIRLYGTTGKQITEYNREIKSTINMPSGDSYMLRDFGVLTFRGSNFRQNAASRNVGDELTRLTVKWKHQMNAVKASDGKTSYVGAAWTGQPAIVRWSVQVRELSNIVEEKKYTRNLTEVILAGNDGRIYFLDLEDGEATRDEINVGYPLRGTPSIHPYGYPLMTVGQYARKVASGTGNIGLRYYNLLNQKSLGMIDGLDGKLDRPLNDIGSFETSALYDPVSDSMVAVGTNGMLYLADLGSSFDYNAGSLSISPDYVTMTTLAKGEKKNRTAVESSPAMYQGYVYYADMAGILRCVDTNSLTNLWAVDLGDSVEAAVALDLTEDNSLWLYTATELNNRTKGTAGIVRVNALTGELDWTLTLDVAKNKKKTSWTVGVKASPVIGQNGLSELVYFTAAGLTASGAESLGLGSKAVDSALIAINKETGKVAWACALPSYTESSPVAVYS